MTKRKFTHFIIEGWWPGSEPRRDAVVHRSVHSTAEDARLLAWAQRNTHIQFPEDRKLFLSVTFAGARALPEPMPGYDSLLAACASYDVCSVEGLAALVEARAKVARTERLKSGFARASGETDPLTHTPSIGRVSPIERPPGEAKK